MRRLYLILSIAFSAALATPTPDRGCELLDTLEAATPTAVPLNDFLACLRLQSPRS
jgi:hypothetical protein